MSAIVCGKRSVFEESIYIPPSPVTKRARWGKPASPSRLPWADDSSAARLAIARAPFEEKFLWLRSMFGEVDDKVVHQVLESCNHDIDSAIQSLKGLHIVSLESANQAQHLADPSTVRAASQPDAAATVDASTVPVTQEGSEPAVPGDGVAAVPADAAEWVEVVVREMMSAADLSDARQRAAAVLEAFEKEVRKRCGPAEGGSPSPADAQLLQQHMATLLKENHILKRAVAIQHERQRDHQVCAEELIQLRQTLVQYQEQLRKLEVSNYALSLHLQKAQDAGGQSLPNRFHPDVF